MSTAKDCDGGRRYRLEGRAGEIPSEDKVEQRKLLTSALMVVVVGAASLSTENDPVFL